MRVFVFVIIASVTNVFSAVDMEDQLTAKDRKELGNVKIEPEEIYKVQKYLKKSKKIDYKDEDGFSITFHCSSKKKQMSCVPHKLRPYSKPASKAESSLGLDFTSDSTSLPRLRLFFSPGDTNRVLKLVD
ncbi:MAG: hypothetical protein ACPGJV_01425 [Bacteriovoracaceae bacterium]